MLKIDLFRERNPFYSGHEKHTTVTFFWSDRFMFPNSSASAIVPLAPGALCLLLFESERQATIRELMRIFPRLRQDRLRGRTGTLEKYEDAMGGSSWLDLAVAEKIRHELANGRWRSILKQGKGERPGASGTIALAED